MKRRGSKMTEKEVHTCTNCKEPFLATHGNEHFCKNCKVVREAKIDYRSPRPCKKCGKIYTPTRQTKYGSYNYLYCRECGKNLNKRNPIRNCLQCGKSLYYSNKRMKGRINAFCNENCALAYTILKYRKERGILPKEQRIEK